MTVFMPFRAGFRAFIKRKVRGSAPAPEARPKRHAEKFMQIPDAIPETRHLLANAMTGEDDRARRNLLAKALAAIDWLHYHLQTVDDAYRQARQEAMRP